MSLPAAFRDRLSLPVIGSPMFIASTPELVIEQCKAGIIGSFPALNARPASALDEWLTRIRGELAEYAAANPGAKVAPFAVNQIAHVSNDRLQHDMDACVRHQVPLIITSLRPPREIVGVVADAVYRALVDGAEARGIGMIGMLVRDQDGVETRDALEPVGEVPRIEQDLCAVEFHQDTGMAEVRQSHETSMRDHTRRWGWRPTSLGAGAGRAAR